MDSADGDCDSDEHAGAAQFTATERDGPCTDSKCVFVKSAKPLNVSLAASLLDVVIDVKVLDTVAQSVGTSFRTTCRLSRLPRDSAVAVCAQLQVWSL